MTERAEDEARAIVGDCSCREGYKSRDLKDPTCQHCDNYDLIVEALKAERRRVAVEAYEIVKKSWVPAGFKMGDGTSVYHPLMPNEIAEAIKTRFNLEDDK